MQKTSSMYKRLATRAALLAVLAVATLAATGAEAGINKRVELTAGRASTVELGQTVSDVLVANPSVVDVGTLRSNRLFLVGKQVGDTNVLAFDGEGNQLADIAVHVNVDQSALSGAMKEFFPHENVDVKTVNNNIVLSGKVSTPLVANRVRDLASRFITTQGQTIVDLMGVEGEQQVMLKVKVMEARRSVLREYGIETDYKPGNAGGTGGFINSTAGIGLTATQPFASGALLLDDNNNFGPFRIGLQALERDGLVNTLAEPNLTAISGETAGFLAGGEFPVPTGTTDSGNTVTLQFKQFGVSLNFTPTVLTENNISLHLSTEVSTLSQEQGVTLVGVQVPGLSVRRAETTVEMASGGSIMIAGLIQSGTADNLNGLPGISDIPILGELFKSKSFQRDESELLIMVTPYLVKPFAAPAAQMASAATDAIPAPVPPPSVSPVEPVKAIPARNFEPVYRQQGEERTQGLILSPTPNGRINAKPPAPRNPDAMPGAPVRQGAATAPSPVMAASVEPAAGLPGKPMPAVGTEKVVQMPLGDFLKMEGKVAKPVAPAPAAETVTAAVKAPAPVPAAAAPVKAVAAKAAPAAASQETPVLSGHLVRNLKATYGAKANTAVQEQRIGYLMD